MRNKEVELNDNTNTDLKAVESEINIEVLDGNLSISGYLRKIQILSGTDREYNVSVILQADGELYEISLPEQ